MPSKKKERPSKSKDSIPASPPQSPPAAHPNPNPNPNPKPRKPKKSEPSSPAPAPSPSNKPKPSAMITPTPAVQDTTDLESPRKINRKRKVTETPEEEPAPAAPPASSGKGTYAAFQRRWTDDDVLTLLNGAAKFRSETSTAPTGTTMSAFFDSIRSSLPKQFTQDQVYNKLRHLRQKYQHSTANGHKDGPLFKLFVEAWGDEAKKPNSVRKEANGDGVKKDEEAKDLEEEDGYIGKSCPRLIKEISEYWKDTGLPEEFLTMATKLVDSTKAKALEAKWQRHHSNELKLQAKRFDLSKDMYLTLAAAPEKSGVPLVAQEKFLEPREVEIWKILSSSQNFGNSVVSDEKSSQEASSRTDPFH